VSAQASAPPKKPRLKRKTRAWEGGGGGMKEPDDLSEYSKTVDYMLEKTALALSLSLVRALSL